MVNKTFRLPEKLVEKLNAIAGKNELSLNRLVIQCLEYSLNNIDKSDLPDELIINYNNCNNNFKEEKSCQKNLQYRD